MRTLFTSVLSVLGIFVLVGGLMALEGPDCDPDEELLYQNLREKCQEGPDANDPSLTCSPEELEVLEKLEEKCGPVDSYPIAPSQEGKDDVREVSVEPRFKSKSGGKSDSGSSSATLGKSDGKVIKVNGKDDKKIANSGGKVIRLDKKNVVPDGVGRGPAIASSSVGGSLFGR